MTPALPNPMDDSRLLPTTEREWLVFIARTQVGASETPQGSNRGPKIEGYQKTTGNKGGDPWCASAMVWCFDRADVRWPFLRSGSVAAIVDSARTLDRLSLEPDAQPGDLMAFWFPSLNRHAHIGMLVERVKPGTWTTIEGNTNAAGGNEGWGVFEKTRTLGASDLILRAL